MSFRPWRKDATWAPESAGDPTSINPTTGIADCCAPAAIGHATAKPPTDEMKLRRLMCPQIEGPNLPYRRGAETALCNAAQSGGQGPVRVRLRPQLLGSYVSSHPLRTCRCIGCSLAASCDFRTPARQNTRVRPNSTCCGLVSRCVDSSD